MSICITDYVLEQFCDESATELAVTGASWQSCILSAGTTTANATATAAGVCMETSFGLETDEPRTHILHNDTQLEDHQPSLQLVPGLCRVFR